MVTRKKIARLTGWGVRGRPFSPSEYARSYIKKNVGGSYPTYLKRVSQSLGSKSKLQRAGIRRSMR